MSFCWATINVQDMEKSLAFYQEIVGLTINRRFSPIPNMEIAFLGCENSETELELIKNDKNTTPKHSSDISLGFTVESIDETIRFLKSKDILDIEGPLQPNPYICFIYILDPDGVRIQLVEKIKA